MIPEEIFGLILEYLDIDTRDYVIWLYRKYPFTGRYFPMTRIRTPFTCCYLWDKSGETPDRYIHELTIKKSCKSIDISANNIIVNTAKFYTPGGNIINSVKAKTLEIYGHYEDMTINEIKPGLRVFKFNLTHKYKSLTFGKQDWGSIQEFHIESENEIINLNLVNAENLKILKFNGRIKRYVFHPDEPNKGPEILSKISLPISLKVLHYAYRDIPEDSYLPNVTELLLFISYSQVATGLDIFKIFPNVNTVVLKMWGNMHRSIDPIQTVYQEFNDERIKKLTIIDFKFKSDTLCIDKPQEVNLLKGEYEIDTITGFPGKFMLRGFSSKKIQFNTWDTIGKKVTIIYSTLNDSYAYQSK